MKEIKVSVKIKDTPTISRTFTDPKRAELWMLQWLDNDRAEIIEWRRYEEIREDIKRNNGFNR